VGSARIVRKYYVRTPESSVFRQILSERIFRIRSNAFLAQMVFMQVPSKSLKTASFKEIFFFQQGKPHMLPQTLLIEVICEDSHTRFFFAIIFLES
jgi:hypothetical protein